jgi:hypothetical protein
MTMLSVIFIILCVPFLMSCVMSAEVDKYSDNLVGNWTWIGGSLSSFATGSAGSDTGLSAISYTVTAVDWSTSKGYVFGGLSTVEGNGTNMIFQMDFKSMSWSRLTSYMGSTGLPVPFGDRGVSLPASSSQPSGRREASLWVVDGVIYVFGGTYDQSILFNDMWMFNISLSQWTWINGNYSGTGSMSQSSVNVQGRYSSGVPKDQVWPPGRFASVSWATNRTRICSL